MSGMFPRIMVVIELEEAIESGLKGEKRSIHISHNLTITIPSLAIHNMSLGSHTFRIF